MSLSDADAELENIMCVTRKRLMCVSSKQKRHLIAMDKGFGDRIVARYGTCLGYGAD
jgi:hypothetical protein